MYEPLENGGSAISQTYRKTVKKQLLNYETGQPAIYIYFLFAIMYIFHELNLTQKQLRYLLQPQIKIRQSALNLMQFYFEPAQGRIQNGLIISTLMGLLKFSGKLIAQICSPMKNGWEFETRKFCSKKFATLYNGIKICAFH